MANIIELHDLSDPGLENFARLTEAQLRNRLEPELGVFIAESPKVIRLALDAGCVPVALLMEQKHITGQGAAIIARCPDIPVYTAERALLKDLTGYALTRGILCAMRRPAPRDVAEVCAGARRIAVLEDIMDATNVGAIFRSAAALELDAVLVTPGCCDPLNRRAVRVSMGTVFQVPWAKIGKKPEDWPGRGLALLREMGVQTVALALSARATAIDQLDAPERMALLLGSEGDGLRENTIAACDRVVRIPMARGVDSLNVAAAAAVAFWQFRTQKPWK